VDNLLFQPYLFYIVEYMKTLIVELDDEVAAKLEVVAPGRTRQRSEFIRNAIRKALWELEEQATAEAYTRQPDSAESAYINPDVWEAPSKARRKRSR
jgi:predicted transcriptional regulator